MVVGTSLARALNALRRNPVLFLAGFIIIIPSTIVALLGSVSVIVYWIALLLSYLLIPFLLGGFYGMAEESLEDTTELGTLITRGKEKYLPLLVSFVGFFAIMFAVGVVLGIAFAIIAVIGILATANPATGAGLSTSGILLLAIIYLLFLLLILIPVAIFQFFDVGIVIGGDSIVETFQNSFRIARKNPSSVAGYTGVRVVFLIAQTVPGIAVLWMASGGQTITQIHNLQGQYLLYYLAVTVVAGTLLAPVLNTYHASYYREIAGVTNLIDKDEDSAPPAGNE